MLPKCFSISWQYENTKYQVWRRSGARVIKKSLPKFPQIVFLWYPLRNPVVLLGALSGITRGSYVLRPVEALVKCDPIRLLQFIFDRGAVVQFAVSTWIYCFVMASLLSWGSLDRFCLVWYLELSWGDPQPILQICWVDLDSI